MSFIFKCCFGADKRDGINEFGTEGDKEISHSVGEILEQEKKLIESINRAKQGDAITCATGSLLCAQRLVRAIAGGSEEAWLNRIDFAVGLVMEHFEAESTSLHAVFDGGLAYASLSASGIGAEDLLRGVPQSVNNDLACSVALLLSNQLRNTAAFIRASTPAANAPVPTSSDTLDSLPPDWQRLHSLHGLRHFIAVPLCSGELVVGVLTLATRQGVVAPASWQPDMGLGFVAASLSLLLQPRQLSIATSILTEVHLARNVDELVRAVRRGVHDLVVATTYLSPQLRVALIRPDGSAAAVFEDQAQRRSSLSLCSEAPAPTGMPEMLQHCTSRRSMETGRSSAQQILMGQITRDRLTTPNVNVNGDLAVVPSIAKVSLPPGLQSAHDGRSPSGLDVTSPNEGPRPGAVSPEGPGAGPTHGASDSPLHNRSIPLGLNERLAVAASMAGLAVGSFFSTNAAANSNAGALAKGGARGHGLSLGNTLLGEALQKDCGLWISDCTLYLQEARTVPRDIVVSRGSRSVHSIAVCSGKHNGTPLLGAYCVYGAVVPRQLLRAVTLELEQMLKLLAPSVSARLSSSALQDEWLYLHQELLNPARVDHLRRMPRTSTSLQHDAATSAIGIGTGGSPICAPASPSGRLFAPRGGARGSGAVADPNTDACPLTPLGPVGQPAQFYVPGRSAAEVQRASGGAAALRLTVGEGGFLPSGVLMSITQESYHIDGEAALVPALAAAAPAASAGGSAAASAGGSLGTPGGAPAVLSTLQALGVSMGPGAALGARGAGLGSGGVLLSLSDAFLHEHVHRMGTVRMGDEHLAPAPGHACGSGVEAGGGRAAQAAIALNAQQLAARGLQPRPASLGSAVASPAGATAFVSALLRAPVLGAGRTSNPAAAAVTVAASGTSSTGSMLRTMLTAPSFTVESVRGPLGSGLRRAPLVSGIHERLAAAQASRLVHGSAIEHQEELAAIDVLEKIGEGGYGEVHRGQYNGTEVAIKIVYEPNTSTSAALPRLTRTNAQQVTLTRQGASGVAEEEMGTATANPGLHDAFELAVSVSVCHPNIVQVLTFFTDVYVHVDRRTSSEQVSLAPCVKSTLQHMVLDLPPYTQLQQLAAADHRGTARHRHSAGSNLATAPRVTLLPYPHNTVTSCQLPAMDVMASQYPEYAALQAAMASNSSAAQRVLAGSPPAMVICMEYCDAGSLADAIVRGSFRQPALGLYISSQLNMKAIFATLLEVALALRHLHSLRLVHCDLKPSNVLLRSSPRDPRGFTAKVSDFGLVRLMEPCSEGGRLAIPKGVTHGTLTHMAPEVLESDGSTPHDAALDIYAFGIMMWQMVYSGRLYPGVNNSDIPSRVVREGMRPRFGSNIPVEYRKLAESCWAASPAARPTAVELVLGLKELMGLGPRTNGQRRYSALAPPRKFPAAAPAGLQRAAVDASYRDGLRPYLLRGGAAAAAETGQGSPREQPDCREQLADGLGRGAEGEECGGDAVAGAGLASGSRSKSSSVRTRSLSYGSFPVHIL